jgi:glycosyltransferase involved in cell wall biosynthesis
LRVAIDTSPTRLIEAGTARYIRELVFALRAHCPLVDVHEFCYEPLFSRRRRVLRTLDTLNREILWLQSTFPHRATACACDLIHSPYTLAPLGASLPLVLTVHDAYNLRNPAAFTFWQRTMFNFMLPRVLRCARAVIAVSQFTKGELLDLYPHLSEAKVTVVHQGIHERFSPPGEPSIQELRARLDLRGPFALSLCTLEPRKNLVRLLEAFARIKDRVPHALILAGSYGWKSAALARKVEDLGLGGRAKFVGFVADALLPALYAAADLFVYPTLYEGFGLPPLEAMACGCPVIASNAASLPEVTGDAAVAVDPYDVSSMAQAMRSVLEDAVLRARLRLRGLRRAKQFTWQRCAQETAEVYRAASSVRAEPTGRA